MMLTTGTGEQADLSLIVVNFNSGQYLVRCLESLRDQDLASHASWRGELVVVDNASPLDQSSYLKRAQDLGSRVFCSPRNTGYAGGCNLGLAQSSGRYVFFLNADVVACAGALEALLAHLDAHPEAGLAEPRTFLDEARAFLIPEIHPLSPAAAVLSTAGQISGHVAHWLSLARVGSTLACWTAKEPREQRALTGAFLAARRDLLMQVGGFDESFPLYYEDADLFRRVRAIGRSLVLVPQAEAVHFAHRSVGTVWNEAMAKCRISRARYLHRHHPWFAPIDRALQELVASAHELHEPTPVTPFVDLGRTPQPVTLELEGEPLPYVLELALEPFFVLAAGHLGRDARFQFSSLTWESLAPATYYLRALDVKTLAPRGAWKVTRAAE